MTRQEGSAGGSVGSGVGSGVGSVSGAGSDFDVAAGAGFVGSAAGMSKSASPVIGERFVLRWVVLGV